MSGVRLWFQRISRLAYRAGTIGLSTGAHITRYAMYKRLSCLSLEWAPDGEAVSISNSGSLASLLRFPRERLVERSYPKHDLRALSDGDNRFVALFADQILEHVESCPAQAIQESFRVVRPGGLIVHTTCFINPRHGFPNDYWRFTPDALRLLCDPHGETIECGGAGNRWIWALDALGLRYMPIPNARWHPAHRIAMNDDPDWPVTTWIISRKR